MKPPTGRTPLILKITAFAFISIAVFSLSQQQHWYSTTRTTSASPEQVNLPSTSQENHLSLPPFASPSYNQSSIRSRSSSSISTTFAITDQNQTQASLPQVSPPPPSGLIRKFGIVDGDGRMCDDFEVGEFYSDPEAKAEEEEEKDGERDKRVIQVLGSENFISIRVKRYEWCPEEMTHYVPCMDNPDSGKTLERRCPDKGKELNCMIPPPKSYRPPIPWPRSRDELWYGNVPRTRGESWISKAKDKYKLAGGGSAKYLDQIARMVPNLGFGTSTRVALDIGCGLGSFGAYMFSRNVITMSIAPKGVNENQIQFALERGVPAMVAALVSHRLSYPSQAFELIHCSKCEIHWTRDDGILLLEVNRILRAGGYFVLAALPVQKQDLKYWKEIFDLANRLCWELVRMERDTAIWRKPLDNSCYLSREEEAKPPLCEPDDDPDIAWNVSLKACITRLPENGYGGNVRTWPARLNSPPDRLQSIQIDPQISRKELMKAEGKYWSEIVASYVKAFHWKKLKLRNIMDMRAGYGGFAAALVDQGFDSWVLNVVPVSGPNTLPVIYDRGLIGVIHDWCEPFDTYPRTYDLLHAADLFSVERKRCKMSTIMLEMDRMLRPGGRAYIQDSLDVMNELQWIAKAMGWQTTLQNTFEGPHASYRILRCDKHLLHP